MNPTTRIVVEGGRAVMKKRRRFSLEGPDGLVRRYDAAKVRLGSAEANDFVVDDETVSRIHAQITAEDTGWRIRDLQSSNGVKLGGFRVRDADLQETCELQLGAARVRFRADDAEVDVPLSRDERLGSLIGRSPLMRELFERIRKAAASDTTVLILGETGSGKEGVAAAVHELSPRAKMPYVVFDCAAVSPQLIESELFGHERGAFTGASGSREGAVEEAEGGTLFLDEIGELSLELQQKLLRLLEHGDFRKVGGSKRQRADVRMVAATHRDLATEVGDGTFREDLFFRLAVIELVVPPLRERPEDIPLLAQHFLREQSTDRDAAQRAMDAIGEATWERLRRHRWPGNVRELRNLIARMLVMGDAPEPRPVAPSRANDGVLEADPAQPWMPQKRELVADLEARYLRAAVEHAGGNLTHAAANAEIERMYFKRLCKKHGVL